MIRAKTANRNSRIKNHHRVPPDPEQIPLLWRQSLVTESLAPESLLSGIARERTRLLDGVPTWGLPEILDSLREPERISEVLARMRAKGELPIAENE